MRNLTLVTGMALTLAMGMAYAETPVHAHGKLQQEADGQPVAQEKYMGLGVLKAVKVNKVQITHEPVAALQWPAMTMWFGLRDALPQDIRVGDSVRFEMMQAETRQWVIVRIERK